MRFGEQADTGDAARLGELMPARFAQRMEIHGGYDQAKQFLQAVLVYQRRNVATVRLHDPLQTVHSLLLGRAALRTELRGPRDLVPAIGTELGVGGRSGRRCGSHRARTRGWTTCGWRRLVARSRLSR